MTLNILKIIYFTLLLLLINANNDRFGFYATGTFQSVTGDSFGVSL